MTFEQFKRAMEDIESFLDSGEGYTLNVSLVNGSFIRDYAWGKLKADDGSELLYLSRSDHPVIYLAPEAIVYVELCAE